MWELITRFLSNLANGGKATITQTSNAQIGSPGNSAVGAVSTFARDPNSGVITFATAIGGGKGIGANSAVQIEVTANNVPQISAANNFSQPGLPTLPPPGTNP